MSVLYVASAVRKARSVAKLAATKKMDRYSGLAAIFSSQLWSRFSVQLMIRLLIFFYFWQRKSANIWVTNLFQHTDVHADVSAFLE